MATEPERPAPVSTPEPDAEDRDPVPAELIEELLAQSEGRELLGEGGLLQPLTKQLLESALETELTDHLGCERGDAAGRGSGNSRNGTSSKWVHTDIGTVDLEVPRDRNGDFEPKIVTKRTRRLEGFNDRIIALYAGRRRSTQNRRTGETPHADCASQPSADREIIERKFWCRRGALLQTASEMLAALSSELELRPPATVQAPNKI